MSDIIFPPTSQVDPSSSNISEVKIVVCRGRSCRKYNGEQVWHNFQQKLPSEIELISVACLGQCGNGAMVVVEPERIWYWQVHPDEVQIIIEQHIIGKSPVKAMLYPKFH